MKRKALSIDLVLEEPYSTEEDSGPAPLIKFVLPERTKVKIEIFDRAGQTVRILADEYQGPGAKTIAWDGKDQNGNLLPEGVYFYQLNAQNYQGHKKILLKH